MSISSSDTISVLVYELYSHCMRKDKITEWNASQNIFLSLSGYIISYDYTNSKWHSRDTTLSLKTIFHVALCALCVFLSSLDKTPLSLTPYSEIYRY